MFLVGNVEDLKWAFNHEVARTTDSPIYINTPYMEVRVILLEPSVYPPYHAHHSEMDEGYLIYRGKGLIHNSGETFEVEQGSVLLNPRGGMHHMKNIGQKELIEFNFRGGRMPSGFIMPEGDPPPNPDPETVDNPANTPVPYILGNVENLVNQFDPTTVKQKGLPKVIATEHLEVRVVSLAPGDQPDSHRHQKEMDEATLVLEGQLKYNIEGEEVVAGPGDLVHVPGGSWHYVKNEGSVDCIILNILGGRLPVRTEWR